MQRCFIISSIKIGIVLEGKQGKQCFQRWNRCMIIHSNHNGNYHDNHSNHNGNYHAEQLLFSCQSSKVSSCQVAKLPSSIPWDSGHAEQMFLCLCSNLTVYRRKWQCFFYTLSCEFRVHRAGSQVIIGIVQVSVFVW